MSGIAGVVHFGGAPALPGQIETLTAAMLHRGPDGVAHWRRGSAALGHCMLRATPEAQDEHQPLSDANGELVIAWDGRLDNRDELRREIASRGGQLRDESDAELVLQSFVQWREDCPLHLLGDFAFAVWDAACQRLFCVVDHIGARPLYYTSNERYFAFASEEEALLVLPGLSGRPNELQIADLLVLPAESFDDQYSWLHDVRGLMPGHSLLISRDGAVTPKQYWRLEPGRQSAYRSDEECREAFLSVFTEAVRCRLRSARPVAAMMSGGMDSAAIAATVARSQKEQRDLEFHTYSAVADDVNSCVESQSILSLTAATGSHAHFMSVPSFEGIATMDDLMEVAWSRPHPVDNSILLPAVMCQAASRRGHRVMLTGVSGDLTMLAPDRFLALSLTEQGWLRAWRECKAASSNHTFLRGASPATLLAKSAWAAYAPSTLWSFAFWLRNRRSRLVPGTINAQFAQRLAVSDRLRTQLAHRARRVRTFDEHRCRLARFLGGPWGFVSGLSGYDRVAGRCGLELRDPWADRRVVEFFLSLPLPGTSQNGWTKYVARNAFAPFLGDKVVWRVDKEHLGPHFYRLPRTAAPMQTAEQWRALFSRTGEYLDIDYLCAQYNTLSQHNVTRLECAARLLSLEMWLTRIGKRDSFCLDG